jgi:hypothetical protein
MDTMLDKEALPDESAVMPNNDADLTEPEIGVDSLEVGLEDTEGTSVYPVPEDKHIGISTDNGTEASATDSIDEANDAILWGTPDDPFTEDVHPAISEEEKSDSEPM